MLDTPEILLYSLAGLGIGIFVFIDGFRALREKRLIENTPTSKIRSLAMGLVEVYGEAMPLKGKSIKSPLSEKECVYYKYTIEVLKSSGKSNTWIIVRSGEDMPNFYIKDDTGTVLIDPKMARIEIPVDMEFTSSLLRPIPGYLKRILKSKKISYKGLLGMEKSMRFREYFIAPGDKLYVMGTADDNPFVEEGSSQKNEADIIIKKGKNFYYISDKPEKDVLKSYKWKVIVGLFGGSAITLFSLLMIFTFTGLL